MQDGSQPLATNQPRFSWKYADNDSVQNVRQTSYRLIVASTKENARRNIGDLWDTKTFSSDQMLYIPYKGKPLESRDKAYWKVVTYVTYTVENRNQEKNNTGTSTIIEVLESETCARSFTCATTSARHGSMCAASASTALSSTARKLQRKRSSSPPSPTIARECISTPLM